MFAVFVCGFGCTAPDPLAGWHTASKNPDQAVVGDYQSYMRTLSSDEQKNLGPSPVSYFEDGTGQHAARIKIGINGEVREHILIYDNNNKRIKTIKYMSGHYAS